MSSDQPIFAMNNKVFNAVSMTTNLTSVTIDLSETTGYALHAIWTGAPVGTISANGSDDGINFVSVASNPTGGTSGQYLLNVEKIHYRYVQITYTFTSGTGSLTAYVSARSI